MSDSLQAYLTKNLPSSLQGLDLSPLLQEAEKRLKRQELRKSYRQFISEFSYEPEPARHHEHLIEKLQAVADGKIPRLMVFMPPGSAKSYYANVMFSAWYSGAHKGKKLITASYAQEVADKWGRRVRGLVRGTDYGETFGAHLSGESSAAGRWELTNGSEYYAVGVGGSVTSFRADLGVIDDPVKGREEADSETIREKTWDWYRDDFWTRLKPNASVVLIMTRWHEDDLAGRLLEDMKNGGEQWEVVSLPMLAESADDALGREINEPLWPEWFTTEMVSEARRDSRRWTSLYQQRPAPEDGDFFRREWIKWYDEKPQHMRIYGASDYAVTEGDGDWTVHLVVGVDEHRHIYLLDLWRGQTDSLAWAESFISLVHQWKPIEWAEEAGQINKSMKPILDRLQIERNAPCYRKAWPSMHDKAARAQSIRGMMALGQVYFPKDAPWVSDFISELMTFPAGKHDDQVDTFSLIGRMLSHLAAADVPKPEEPPQYGAKTFNDLLAISQRRNRTDY